MENNGGAGLHYSPLTGKIYYSQVKKNGVLKAKRDFTKQVITTFMDFLMEGKSLKVRSMRKDKAGYKSTMILHLNNTDEGIDKAIRYLQTLKKK